MGVSEDLNWLKEDKDGVGRVFLLIANKGSARLRELHELFGVEDWWPVKTHLRALVERGLIAETEGSYRLSGNGLKVLDGVRAIEYVEPV